MAFLAGSFFIVPNPEIEWTSKILGGNSLRVLDFLPATPAVRLMRTILLGQQSLQNSWFDLVLLATLSAIYLIIGLLTYSRRHFRPE
jgi:ABC-type polysaccharide/polyol phosphate export permease